MTVFAAAYAGRLMNRAMIFRLTASLSFTASRFFRACSRMADFFSANSSATVKSPNLRRGRHPQTMAMAPTPQPDRATLGLLSLVVPGPDRKRRPAPYSYRIAFRNPGATEGECVMVWDVYGGRLPYQVAAERNRTGVRYYCTCA